MPPRNFCQYLHHIPTSARAKNTLGTLVKYCTKAQTWLVQQGLPVIDLIKIQGLAVQFDCSDTDLAFVCNTCGSLQASAVQLALHLQTHTTQPCSRAAQVKQIYMPVGRVLNMSESNDFCPVVCPFCLSFFLGSYCLQHHLQQGCWGCFFQWTSNCSESIFQQLSTQTFSNQLRSCGQCSRLDNLLKVHDWFPHENIFKKTKRSLLATSGWVFLCLKLCAKKRLARLTWKRLFALCFESPTFRCNIKFLFLTQTQTFENITSFLVNT